MLCLDFASGSHAAHAGMSHGASMSHEGMPMYFTWRARGPILFSFLTLDSTASYLLFLLVLATACAAREWLAIVRMRVESERLEAARLKLSSSSPAMRWFSYESLSSLLHALNMALAYAIMLSVMSYDACMFLVVLIASGGAHYWLNYARRGAMSSGSSNSGRSGATPRLASQHATIPEDDEEAFTERQGLTPGGRNALAAAESKKAAALAMHFTKDCCES